MQWLVKLMLTVSKIYNWLINAMVSWTNVKVSKIYNWLINAMVS